MGAGGSVSRVRAPSPSPPSLPNALQIHQDPHDASSKPGMDADIPPEERRPIAESQDETRAALTSVTADTWCPNPNPKTDELQPSLPQACSYSHASSQCKQTLPPVRLWDLPTDGTTGEVETCEDVNLRWQMPQLIAPQPLSKTPRDSVCSKHLEHYRDGSQRGRARQPRSSPIAGSRETFSAVEVCASLEPQLWIRTNSHSAWPPQAWRGDLEAARDVGGQRLERSDDCGQRISFVASSPALERKQQQSELRQTQQTKLDESHRDLWAPETLAQTHELRMSIIAADASDPSRNAEFSEAALSALEDPHRLYHASQAPRLCGELPKTQSKFSLGHSACLARALPRGEDAMNPLERPSTTPEVTNLAARFRSVPDAIPQKPGSSEAVRFRARSQNRQRTYVEPPDINVWPADWWRPPGLKDDAPIAESNLLSSGASSTMLQASAEDPARLASGPHCKRRNSAPCATSTLSSTPDVAAMPAAVLAANKVLQASKTPSSRKVRFVDIPENHSNEMYEKPRSGRRQQPQRDSLRCSLTDFARAIDEVGQSRSHRALIRSKRRSLEGSLVIDFGTEFDGKQVPSSRVSSELHGSEWMSYVSERHPVPLGALPSLSATLKPNAEGDVEAGIPPCSPRATSRARARPTSTTALAFPWNQSDTTLWPSSGQAHSAETVARDDGKLGLQTPVKCIRPGTPLRATTPTTLARIDLSRTPPSAFPSNQAIERCISTPTNPVKGASSPELRKTHGPEPPEHIKARVRKIKELEKLRALKAIKGFESADDETWRCGTRMARGGGSKWTRALLGFRRRA